MTLDGTVTVSQGWVLCKLVPLYCPLTVPDVDFDTADYRRGLSPRERRVAGRPTPVWGSAGAAGLLARACVAHAHQCVACVTSLRRDTRLYRHCMLARVVGRGGGRTRGRDGPCSSTGCMRVGGSVTNVAFTVLSRSI